MNYTALIHELRRRLLHVDRAIATMEALRDGQAPPPSRRGRKPNTMSAQERADVANRMRQYWASRRKAARA